MARGKKHSPEQVVNLLRQIEVAVANGKTTSVGCRGSQDQGVFAQRCE
jgi:putative transposase